MAVPDSNPRSFISSVIAAVGDMSACSCLLYTSDAADERSSVDLGGRRIIKKKNNNDTAGPQTD